MKYSIMVLLFSLVGCATSPRQATKDDMIDALRQDTYKLDEEEKVPAWVNEAGFKDGNFVGVGAAEASADQSPIYLKRAAMMDAESQLFSKTPHEYREAVQHAVEGSGMSFQSVQTKLLRLSGVSGVNFPPDKSYCYKAMRDNGEYIAVKRVCYQQAVVPISAMNKAIERTIAQYYSQGKSESFMKLMNSEIEQIQGGKKNEEAHAAPGTPSSPHQAIAGK